MYVPLHLLCGIMTLALDSICSSSRQKCIADKPSFLDAGVSLKETTGYSWESCFGEISAPPRYDAADDVISLSPAGIVQLDPPITAPG